MKAISSFIICTGILVGSMSSAFGEGDDSKHHIGAGYHAATVDLSDIEVITIGYEYRLNDSWGLQVTYVDFEYEYEDDEDAPFYYEYEEGEGFSIELSANYYPSQGGFFIGFGFGGGNIDWSYIEIEDSTYADSEKSFGYELFGKLGYQAKFGPVFVTPALQIGKWFDIGEEVDIYAAAGVSVGMHF